MLVTASLPAQTVRPFEAVDEDAAPAGRFEIGLRGSKGGRDIDDRAGNLSAVPNHERWSQDRRGSANAILESDGDWTVVVVGNLDPPNASRVGTAIKSKLP